MIKKYYLYATIAFLLIPVVTVLGGLIFNAINPEIAAGYANYERNYRLLDLAKRLSLLAALLVMIALWFLTCYFLLKSKQQAYEWSLLAIFGPFGFIALTLFSDKAPSPADLYQQFVGKLKILLRMPYELCFFVAAWLVAFQLVVLKRELMILYEAATTGISKAQIIERQNASSGMWAFSEGLQTLYLVVLFYLLWPICFNAAGHLAKRWSYSRKPDTPAA